MMVSEMESVNNDSVTDEGYENSSDIQQHQMHTVHAPQTVGVEFVRQYYTILNKAPNLLYRFYSEDSTLIHGCLDIAGSNPRYYQGREQIDEKIKSMHFKDCHTKIRQVDSMETLGYGVVIQVIGELSNNGQPLRSFLQTFVLAPNKSPNKYYVRNDIFRYQDEYDDDPCVIDDEKSEIDDCVKSLGNNNEDLPLDEPNVEKEYDFKQNGDNGVEKLSPAEEKIASPPQPPSPREIESIKQLIDTVEPKVPIEETLKPEENIDDNEQREMENISNNNDDNLDDGPKASISPSVNEPKTYAGILGRSSQGVASIGSAKNIFPGDTSASFIGDNANVVNQGSPAIVNTVPKSFVAPAVSAVQQQQPQQQQQQQPQQYRFQRKNYNRRNDSKESGKNNDSDSGDGADHFNANAKKYPDENQLFIGNLLPDFSEDVLHKIFGKFGKILDIRINRQKMPNSKNRNYGFITFESAEVVDQIIALKPIYHENHRYNVEKKQGKSSINNYDRGNRERGMGGGNSHNLVRNPNTQSSNPNMPMSGGGGNARHMSSANVGSNAGGGQANPIGQRNRIGGPNYHSSNNNGNNPNMNRGQHFQNRNNMFNQQQQPNR